MSEAPPVYSDLGQRPSRENRPWVAINMIATIDGKILSGNRDENVMDLGSNTDHATMRAIEAAGDAVLIGAGSLRATVGLWYPIALKRFVASASVHLDFQSRFFLDAPEQAWVVTTPEGATKLPNEVQRIVSGPPIEWPNVLARMKHELGVERLLVEGGSELNASILASDLVDELFLTVAPKIKLGRDVPTYADGEALPRDKMLRFELVDHRAIGDEVYLHYRRR